MSKRGDGNKNDGAATSAANITSDPPFEKMYSYIESNEARYIAMLSEAVSIQSISSDESKAPEIVRMMEWTCEKIRNLGGEVRLLPNPASPNLPPILLGSFPSSLEGVGTVCCYGHLDVQPAEKEDGWDTDPFKLTLIDGKMYGRGTTDDKGPALCWLHAVEAYKNAKCPLPLNIKVIFEGLEEYGSSGMFDAVRDLIKSGEFLDDVDYYAISDNYWLGRNKPCLTYGLRGVSYFEVAVTGSNKDLHSGVYGGTVHEAMTDLVQIFATLVNTKGKIMIDGIMDKVAPLTEKEKKLYEKIDFDLADYREDVGVSALLQGDEDKAPTLLHRWRYPTLSLHGIEGAFSGKGAKTVIPGRVVGKFSIRTVPDMDPASVERNVRRHIDKVFEGLGSPNKLDLVVHPAAKPWLSDVDHANYVAGAAAVRAVHGVDPDYTREGGSIPIANWIADLTGMNVLLLPMGACDDGAHSQNEKFDVKNMMDAVKILVHYIHELGKIKGPRPSTCRCVMEEMSPEDLAMPGAFARGLRCKCEW